VRLQTQQCDLQDSLQGHRSAAVLQQMDIAGAWVYGRASVGPQEP